MARNRSQDPFKSLDPVGASDYNSILSGFSLKLKALESKYSVFVAHCLKIIKDAQKFIDFSINEHINNSMNQSSKLIENLNMQKVKLKKDLNQIERMSFDFQNIEGPLRQAKFLQYFKGAKEKILEKLDEHKAKNFIQTVLMNLEDRFSKEMEVFENFGGYYARLHEVEEMLSKKNKEFDSLLESYNRMKEGDSDRKTVTSPRNFSSGRTSPANFYRASREQEVKKLQEEINFLKEKLVGLTGQAKKIVAKKESEIQKMIQEKSRVSASDFRVIFEVFEMFQEKAENKIGVILAETRRLCGRVDRLKLMKKITNRGEETHFIIKRLENLVNELKDEIKKKDENLAVQKERFSKLNKLYSELHEKSKIFGVRFDGLVGEVNEKTEKNKEMTGKMEELLIENEKLRSYKTELDKEINELKEYFQSDIDNLSDKIEKLFGENLVLKKKNEEIREKYEKVMVEKEKLLVGIFEKQANEVQKSDKVNTTSLALKQELKISSAKIEALSKELSGLKLSQKKNTEKIFLEIFEYFNEFSGNTLEYLNSSVKRFSGKAIKIKAYLRNFKPARTSSKSASSSNSLLVEANRKNARVLAENESLMRKCENYEKLVINLQTTCEKLTSQQDSLYKCPTCENYSVVIKDKDERILYLQKEIYTLCQENIKLKSDIQEIEFTFQNNSKEQKPVETVSEKPSKSSRNLLISSDFKGVDSKCYSPTVSDIELTYTFEGTTIKSTHDPTTPMSVSNEEIKDLEFI